MGPLSILCFGNSLTAGWTRLGNDLHPYANTLVSSLEKHLPSIRITANVQGLPGDQVISPPGGFLPRMDILYQEAETPYTWAVILGGTNDLIMGSTADDIWSALKEVYEIPLQAGTRVLALTVPECGDCSASIDEQRDRFNSLILAHEAENFNVFDLHSAIPFRSMPEDRRKEIWFDNTHFTAAGYDLLGLMLSERIWQLISERRMPAKAMAQTPLKAD